MSLAGDIAALDATAQADLVRKREVSPLELVDAALARIERANPKVNAIVHVMADQARAAAEAPPPGPFAGVPFLIKDLIAGVAGEPMKSGCAFTKDYVSRRDSELVTRLRGTGLVFVGKTSTPELGIVCTTEPQLGGATRNPWDPTRTTGGSSGGAAAAVALGIVPMAHGGDGGGSIRIPASCCGLFGLKPTRGRNPLGPDLGDVMSGLVVEHALTRSVRDSAALLDATGSPDLGDPYHAPAKARPYLEEVATPPGRLRIALMVKPATGTALHPDCEAAVRDAAALLASLGHEVVEDAPRIDAALLGQAFTAVWASGVTATVDGFAHVLKRKPTPGQFEPLTWALYEMGKQVHGGQYLLAWGVLHRMAREAARFGAGYDAVLTPTLAEPPVPLGTFDAPEGAAMMSFLRQIQFTPYTAVCNMTGQPAMSVPLYWNGEGLPIGSHLMGRFGDEATLFRLAAQLEEARPWRDRRPALWREVNQ